MKDSDWLRTLVSPPHSPVHGSLNRSRLRAIADRLDELADAMDGHLLPSEERNAYENTIAHWMERAQKAERASDWTTTPPTAPGWYWMWRPNAIEVVEVWINQDEVPRTLAGVAAADLEGIRWAGPIPEPRDDKDARALLTKINNPEPTETRR